MARFVRWLVAIFLSGGVFALSWLLAEAIFRASSGDAIGIASMAAGLVLAPASWWASLPAREVHAFNDNQSLASPVPRTSTDAPPVQRGTENDVSAAEARTTGGRRDLQSATEVVRILSAIVGQMDELGRLEPQLQMTQERRMSVIENGIGLLQDELHGALSYFQSELADVVPPLNRLATWTLPQFCSAFQTALYDRRAEQFSTDDNIRARKEGLRDFRNDWETIRLALLRHGEMSSVAKEARHPVVQAKALGYAGERDLSERVRPTMDSFGQPSGVTRALLSSLLRNGYLTPYEITSGGVSEPTMEELSCRLTSSGWARWVQETRRLILTEPGRESLAQLLEGVR